MECACANVVAVGSAVGSRDHLRDVRKIATHLDLGQSEQTLDLTDEAIEFDRLDVIIVAACFYRLVAIAAHRARA